MIEVNYIGRDSIFDFQMRLKLFAYNIGDNLIIQNLRTSEKMKAIQHQKKIKSILFIGILSNIDDNEIMSTDGDRLAIQNLERLHNYAQIRIPSEQNEQISALKSKDFLLLIYHAECGYRMTVFTYREQNLRIVLSSPLEAQNKFLKILPLSQDIFIICEKQGVKFWHNKDKELSLKNKINFSSSILDCTTNQQDKMAFVLTERKEIHLITQHGVQLTKITAIPPTTLYIAYMNQGLFITTPHIQRLDMFDSSVELVKSECNIPVKRIFSQEEELIVVHENEAISLITPNKKSLSFFSLNPKIVKAALFGHDSNYILTPYYLYKFANSLEILFESDYLLSTFYKAANELVFGSETGQIFKNQKWVQGPDTSRIEKIFILSSQTFFVQNQQLYKVSRSDKFESILQDVLKVRIYDQQIYVLNGWGIYVYTYKQSLQEQFKIPGTFSLDFQMHKNNEMFFQTSTEGIEVYGVTGKYKGIVWEGDYTMFRQDPSGLYVACLNEKGLSVIEIGTRKQVASYEVMDASALVFGWEQIGVVKGGSGMVFLDIPEEIKTNIFEAMKMQVRVKDFWKRLYMDFEDKKPLTNRSKKGFNDQQTIELNFSQQRNQNNKYQNNNNELLNESINSQIEWLEEKSPGIQMQIPVQELNQQIHKEMDHFQQQDDINNNLNKLQHMYNRRAIPEELDNQRKQQFFQAQHRFQRNNKQTLNRKYSEHNEENQQNQAPFHPVSKPQTNDNNPHQQNYQKYQYKQQLNKDLQIHLDNLIGANEMQDMVQEYKKQIQEENPMLNQPHFLNRIHSPQNVFGKKDQLRSPPDIAQVPAQSERYHKRYQEVIDSYR